jgi:hypothetical protein
MSKQISKPMQKQIKKSNQKPSQKSIKKVLKKISKNSSKLKPLYVNKLIKYKTYYLPKRLALRARSFYIGRTGSHINRTEKLISILSYSGGRKKIENAVFDLKIRIKEYFLH